MYQGRCRQTQEFCQKKPHWMATNTNSQCTVRQGKHNKCSADKINHLKHMNKHFTLKRGTAINKQRKRHNMEDEH